jgi:hypothetical protein
MRFRIGAVLGFAAGYVLGAKAGRYRYEQIMKVAGRVWESQPMEMAREQTGKVMGDMQTKASDGFRSFARNQDDKLSARTVALP